MPLCVPRVMTSARRWAGEEREFADCHQHPESFAGRVWSGRWEQRPPPSWVPFLLANTLLFFFSYWCVSSSQFTTQCILSLMDTYSGFSMLFLKQTTHLAKLNSSLEGQWPAYHWRVSGITLWPHIQGLCYHPVSLTPLCFALIPSSWVIHSTLKSHLLIVAVRHKVVWCCAYPLYNHTELSEG